MMVDVRFGYDDIVFVALVDEEWTTRVVLRSRSGSRRRWNLVHGGRTFCVVFQCSCYHDYRKLAMVR